MSLGLQNKLTDSLSRLQLQTVNLNKGHPKSQPPKEIKVHNRMKKHENTICMLPFLQRSFPVSCYFVFEACLFLICLLSNSRVRPFAMFKNLFLLVFYAYKIGDDIKKRLCLHALMLPPRMVRRTDGRKWCPRSNIIWFLSYGVLLMHVALGARWAPLSNKLIRAKLPQNSAKKAPSGSYIFQRLFLRGLYTVRNLRYKIDSVAYSWKINKKKIMLPYRFCFVLLCVFVGYIWKGFYIEGLIFRILRYLYEKTTKLRC